jgi:myo-inositol-1(or 4)-monophosphatase
MPSRIRHTYSPRQRRGDPSRKFMPDLDLALRLAARITRTVRPLLGKRRSSDRISFGDDPRKMRLDAEAAKAVRSGLKESDISCHLISEEWGCLDFGRDPRSYLIVDEFDGTFNGTRGIPFSAVSIAISEEPRLKDVHIGVVVDMFQDVTYYAVKNRGAYRDGRRIRAFQRRHFDDCIMSIKMASSPRETIERVERLLLKTSHGRDFGAAALELSLIASGQLDAVVDTRRKTRVTDIAAGFLLVKEAGGKFQLLNESLRDVPLKPDERLSFVAASGPQVMNRVVNLIER